MNNHRYTRLRICATNGPEAQPSDTAKHSHTAQHASNDVFAFCFSEVPMSLTEAWEQFSWLFLLEFGVNLLSLQFKIVLATFETCAIKTMRSITGCKVELLVIWKTLVVN